MTTIAIMQPYFIPYAGYFRLLAHSDVFVIYDCVQFNRRGWLHRNQLATYGGSLGWLTLPLQKADREVKIANLVFRTGASDFLNGQLRRFPIFENGQNAELRRLILDTAETSVVDYLAGLLHWSAKKLDIPWRVVRSSSLGIDPFLKAEDRILAILAALGAAKYLNAPGGKDLYDPARFARKGVELQFLPPYIGSFESIAGRLSTEPADLIRAQIDAQI